jgi:hypothetical protein
MKVGNGLEDGVVQGPLIDMKAVEKVEEHISDAVGKGARVVIGGKRHEKGGQYFQPTVLADVTTAMKVTREETFGPVAPLYRFKTEEELLRLANDTEFGLAARRGRARVRHHRHQRGHHFQRSCAFRRREGIGHRSRRVEVRNGRVPRGEILVHGRHQQISS